MHSTLQNPRWSCGEENVSIPDANDIPINEICPIGRVGLIGCSRQNTGVSIRVTRCRSGLVIVPTIQNDEDQSRLRFPVKGDRVLVWSELLHKNRRCQCGQDVCSRRSSLTLLTLIASIPDLLLSCKPLIDRCNPLPFSATSASTGPMSLSLFWIFWSRCKVFLGPSLHPWKHVDHMLAVAMRPRVPVLDVSILTDIAHL